MDPKTEGLYQQYIDGFFFSEADKETMARMLTNCAEQIRETERAYERACMEVATAEMLTGQAFGL
jgi:hypothetical protein